jgi:uncharacterized RDD family membrane protein YckC
MDTMETPLEQSPETRNGARVADEPRCPLCERLINPRWLRKNPAKIRLNEVVVCGPCRNGFANRRQLAYIIDWIIIQILTVAALSLVESMVGGVLAGSPGSSWRLQYLADIGMILAVRALLFCKDGFAGQSPGKALFGLQVIDWDTREPIGFGRSLKRNLPLLIPYVPLVLAFTLLKGWRWGDRWARTRVIWKKHAFKLPFDPWGIRCPICGYDLTGNVSGVCPECGTPIRSRKPPVAIGQARC